MKLNKACKRTRDLCNKDGGLRLWWVAVDKSGDIFAYARKPVLCPPENRWRRSENHLYQSFEWLGEYTGKKHWTKTLREVKYYD